MVALSKSLPQDSAPGGASYGRASGDAPLHRFRSRQRKSPGGQARLFPEGVKGGEAGQSHKPHHHRRRYPQRIPLRARQQRGRLLEASCPTPLRLVAGSRFGAVRAVGDHPWRHGVCHTYGPLSVFGRRPKPLHKLHVNPLTRSTSQECVSVAVVSRPDWVCFCPVCAERELSKPSLHAQSFTSPSHAIRYKSRFRGEGDPMRRVRLSRRKYEEPRMGCGLPSPALDREDGLRPTVPHSADLSA